MPARARRNLQFRHPERYSAGSHADSAWLRAMPHTRIVARFSVPGGGWDLSAFKIQHDLVQCVQQREGVASCLVCGMQVAHSGPAARMPPRQLFPEGLACRFAPEQTDEFNQMILFFLLPALRQALQPALFQALLQALLRAKLPRVFLDFVQGHHIRLQGCQ